MGQILKIQFIEITVEKFWISVQTKFKTISKNAIIILLQLLTLYLRELGFSTFTNIKINIRERLTNIEKEIKVIMAYIRSDIENINCKNYKA